MMVVAMKPRLIFPIVFLVVSSVLAAPSADARGWNKKQIQKANREDAKKEKKEREAREKRSKAIDDCLTARDGNKDGSLTRDEFLTGESDKKSAAEKFDKFNKNGDRYLSKSELATMLGF